MMPNNSLGSDQSNDSRSQGSDWMLLLLTKRFNEWDTLQKQLPLNDCDQVRLAGIESQLQMMQTKLANQPSKIRNNEGNNVYLDKLSQWKPTIVSPNPPSAILLERTGTIHSSLTEESSQYKTSSTPPTLSVGHYSCSPTTNQSSDPSAASYVAVPENNRRVVLPFTKNCHVPPTQHTTTNTAFTVVTVDEDQQHTVDEDQQVR